MPLTYRVYNQNGVYYITCTVRQWVDVFTRNEYRDILVDSLKYCQEHKGLEIYAWVIMTNHIHLIIGSSKDNLSDIIRDFKKYTSSQVVAAIRRNHRESRSKWLLWLLHQKASILFWQEGYHGEEITSREFYKMKERYIHLNPVRAGYVEKEEHYLYSSCRERYGLGKSLLRLAEL